MGMVQIFRNGRQISFVEYFNNTHDLEERRVMTDEDFEKTEFTLAEVYKFWMKVCPQYYLELFRSSLEFDRNYMHKGMSFYKKTMQESLELIETKKGAQARTDTEAYLAWSLLTKPGKFTSDFGDEWTFVWHE